MRKLVIFTCLFVAAIIIVGCGTQNEYLSKGKEWVKSDKRGRMARAVAQFELATEREPDNAEAHYLLGYYDENATIEKRAKEMALAYKYKKKKYLKILIEEALRDRNENVRKSAALALWKINKDIDPMIAPLLKTLRSKDSRDRDDAALVLSSLHNHREVVARLTEKRIMEYKRTGTRFDAVRALGDIGNPEAIDAIMKRITALKTEDEKGEEPEVRRAGVRALRQIARRDIEITGQSLDIQVDLAEEGEGVSITKVLSNKTTLQEGEVITHIIDNKKITSREDYENLLKAALRNSENIIFGLPKIVTVTVSNIEELGIREESVKPAPGGEGIVIEKLTIDSRAGKRGIEKGETISHINNQKVNSVEDYKRIVDEAISEGLLFSIDLMFQSDLDSNNISEELRQEFQKNEISLSQNTTLSIEEQQYRWLIKDEDENETYTVSKKEDSLDIYSKDKKVKFKVANDDKYRLLSVPVPEDNRDLGMEVLELPAGAEGVIVTEVRPRSPAVEAGVRKGQIISYIVSERKIDGVSEYKQLLAEGLEDGKVIISVINKKAIQKLIDVLRNKGLIVRFDAAQALGEVENKAAVDSLIQMLQEEGQPIELTYSR